MGTAEKISTCLVIGLCLAAAIAPSTSGSDSLANLKQFSDFSQFDVKSLARGETLSQRGPLMSTPYGIRAQFLFFVPASPEEVAGRLQSWDPSCHEDLKVYAFHGLKASGTGGIKGLNLDPAQRPVKWLLDKTQATTASRSDLNLSRHEAQELAACTGKDPRPGAVSSCWAGLLAARVDAFRRYGLSGVPPYEVGEELFSPAAQLPPMLLEDARISREFAPILRRAGIVNGAVNGSPLAPRLFWSLFEADRHATLNLGAVYLLAINDHYQLLSVEYYVSGTYYTAATLYEIWPVKAGGITGSLVWRGDFYAAPVLRVTKGIERIAYGAIMIQEIKKEISCLRKDLCAGPTMSSPPAGHLP